MAESKKEDPLQPFYRFLKNPEIDMLNAALPFLSDHMRTLLALYIKTREMRRIMMDFDQEEILTACGFEKSSPDPEAMLRAMKIAGGPNVSPQIDQALHMMNLLKTYRNFHEMMQNNPEMAAVLNSMINQNSNPVQNRETPHPNNISPQDLLKQFSQKDSSDLLSLLSQMLSQSS